MEEELTAALQLYLEQCAAFEAHLQSYPDDTEAQQLLGELSEAIATTQDALAATAAAGDSAEGSNPAEQPAGAGGGTDTTAGAITAAAVCTVSELEATPVEAHEQGLEPPSKRPRLCPSTLANRNGIFTHQAAGSSTRQQPTTIRHPRMHPANLYYNQEPDFVALAEQQPQYGLQRYMSIKADGRAAYQFTSWEATRALTAALLAQHFDIRAWWLPEGQLIPPVTNRGNYLHWIDDLLTLSSPPDAAVCIRGLDVGCGASFIYCLLGAAMYGWHMTGLDITQVAVEHARSLIEANPHLADLLHVIDASGTPTSHAQLHAIGMPFGKPAPANRRMQEAAAAAAAAATATAVTVTQPQTTDTHTDTTQTHTSTGETRRSATQPNGGPGGQPGASANGSRERPSYDTDFAWQNVDSANAAVADAAIQEGSMPAPRHSGHAHNRDSRGSGHQLHDHAQHQEHSARTAAGLGPILDPAFEPAQGLQEAESRVTGRVLAGDGEAAACQSAPCMYAFTMCNPPFFESMRQAGANPSTAFGGTAAEMVYPGGESAFVAQLIADSSRLRHGAHWFTTMLGKKATLKSARSQLHGMAVTALRTTELAQGRTSRWALAWSWRVPQRLTSTPLPRRAASCSNNSGATVQGGGLLQAQAVGTAP